MKPKRILAGLGLAAALVLLALAAARFASGLAYGSYIRALDEVKSAASRAAGQKKDLSPGAQDDMAGSVESAFPDLERRLLRAIRIGGLLPLSRDPSQDEALAKLYLDRAQAIARFADPGDPEAAGRRDGFIDKALEAGAVRIRLAPSDSWAYFEAGKAYLLYNFPLLTYAEKGRLFLRRAAELNPAHEFLNLNILYLFFTQWDGLADPEREFALARFEALTRAETRFAAKLRGLWRDNLPSDEGLRTILQARPALWERVQGAFK